MAEAVNDVGELSGNGRIDIHRVGEHETINVRRNRPGKFFKYQVLIDLFGREPAGLEQTFTVPVKRLKRRRVGRNFRNWGVEPLVDEPNIRTRQDLTLDLFDTQVVLTMEHGVDGSQTNVLVTAPVTDDKVSIEQLVVIG